MLTTHWNSAAARLVVGVAVASCAAIAQVPDTESRLNDLETELAKLREELAAGREPALPANQGGRLPPVELHGFGQFTFQSLDTDPGVTTDRFTAGLLDLFISSQINDRASFMTETAFEFEASGEVEVNVHRVHIKYDVFDWLSCKVGRMHARFGYWNNAFHHGEWLQTSIGRPAVLGFGAVLPIHLDGLELASSHHLGGHQLDATLQIANGRGPTSNMQQRVVDANNSKSINLQVVFRPEPAPGLQLGIGAYFDDIPRNTDASAGPTHGTIDERILSANAAWLTDRWEVLVEYFDIHHDAQGAIADSNGMFAQAGLRIDAFTPYARFDYLRVDAQDAYYPTRNDQLIWAIGTRWDFSSFNALKLQVSHRDTDRPTAADLTLLDFSLQWSFAF